MPFTHINSRGKPYVLHAREVKSRAGRRYRMYYFAPHAAQGTTVDVLPVGYRVVEDARTERPFLRRIVRHGAA